MTAGLDPAAVAGPAVVADSTPRRDRILGAISSQTRTRAGKPGICSQAPSDPPNLAQFLVEQGIDNISLNPDTALKTTKAILEKEKSLRRLPAARNGQQRTIRV